VKDSPGACCADLASFLATNSIPNLLLGLSLEKERPRTTRAGRCMPQNILQTSPCSGEPGNGQDATTNTRRAEAATAAKKYGAFALDGGVLRKMRCLVGRAGRMRDSSCGAGATAGGRRLAEELIWCAVTAPAPATSWYAARGGNALACLLMHVCLGCHWRGQFGALTPVDAVVQV